MVNEVTALDVIHKFNRMINKFSQLEKAPRDYGTGAVLYSSEIHLIETIGKRPGVNVTELAKKHGITKAAISQKLRKLEEKGLVERFKLETNNKAVLLRLKPEGQAAFEGHKDFHTSLDQPLVDVVSQLPEEYIGFFEGLFDEIGNYADTIAAKKPADDHKIAIQRKVASAL